MIFSCYLKRFTPTPSLILSISQTRLNFRDKKIFIKEKTIKLVNYCHSPECGLGHCAACLLTWEVRKAANCTRILGRKREGNFSKQKSKELDLQITQILQKKKIHISGMLCSLSAYETLSDNA